MRNILEYNSYEIISSLEDGISNIFPYVKVITNKIYASTLISKSGRPIVRIDSKNPVKALLLEVKEDGLKNFGFNITRIEQNYVEFRYAGGEISKDALIDKLKYFSFLVYCMTNVEYKRREYLNKLYKFVDSL